MKAEPFFSVRFRLILRGVMITITRKFTFDAGHRVLGHESKCKHLHGHTYHVELTVQSLELDELGRVIDFSLLKSMVGKWIDDELDHNLLLHPNDPIAPSNLALSMHSDVYGGDKLPYVFPSGCNPTAENIAKEICRKALEILPDYLYVISVRVHETPNCSAEYRNDNR